MLRLSDSQLIHELHKISKDSPKLVRSTVYTIPSDPSVSIRSWKMNEFKYNVVPSPFPTLARGLFTRDLPYLSLSGEQPKSIVARGYDKFFNIGEVAWTTWESLSLHTGPPYTLSLKSNGCIIFIAPISPSKLIVTSKHALGPMNGVADSHSEVGYRWLKKHLAYAGKSEQQLAEKLWEKNWTAVTELCDDSFEEHVLPYPVEKSGLHLHGINENTTEFITMPTEIVDAFAKEWGFIETPTISLRSIPEVKSFTDDIAKTGKWNGEPLEGFVIRTHIVDTNQGSTTSNTRPPRYDSGSSFFFKVKFDEPYMMYRDWREITKTLLTTKGPLGNAKIPLSKMKREETRNYVNWVKKEIAENLGAFAGFTKGKGIIATRERFLKWTETDEGKRSIFSEVPPITKTFGKTIIVPMAIPGCGKTAVSVALASLFGFGHTQSDDVHGKKSAPAFIQNVVSLLKDHDVVIADKNNHLEQHRTSLRTAVAKMNPPVRLLALHWALDRLPQATIHRICGDRVFSRGNKHQTLHADALAKTHENVIWQFIHTAQKLNSDEVNVSIEMHVEDNLEQAINRAVAGCVGILDLQQPSAEEIDEAVCRARDYVPLTIKPDQKKKEYTPRYFGILPEINLQYVIGKRMEEASDVLENGKTFWNNLVAKNRVTSRPHITVVHKQSLRGHTELWERCDTLHRMPFPPIFTFALKHLVWNQRVMAITVDDFDLELSSARDGQEGNEFVSQLSEEVRNGLHVTVGTSDSSVAHIEAKLLTEAWRAGDRLGVGWLDLDGVVAKGRVKGLMH